jgi:hypothetical protein
MSGHAIFPDAVKGIFLHRIATSLFLPLMMKEDRVCLNNRWFYETTAVQLRRKIYGGKLVRIPCIAPYPKWGIVGKSPIRRVSPCSNFLLRKQ